MFHLRVYITAVAACLATPVYAATAIRSFVASNGNDANACSRTAPCRTFGAAIAQTTAGGEVIVLDTAGYGPFTITKAVSVTAPEGIVASIKTTGGDGVTISAGINDVVVLKGLVINGNGSGNGVTMTSGFGVSMDHCTISQFSSGNGINFAAASRLTVRNCVVRQCHDGIFVNAPLGVGITVAADYLAHAVITDTLLEFNNYGLYVQDNCRVTIQNSVVTGKGKDSNLSYAGIVSLPTANNPNQSIINVRNCLSTYNFLGIGAGPVNTGGNGQVSVSDSTITDNVIGMSANGGSKCYTYGNNHIGDNDTASFFNSPNPTLQ